MEKKIALVTGANRGIGYAVAEGLLQKGVRVIFTSRKENSGKAALKGLSQYDEVVYQQLDVTDVDSIKAVSNFLDQSFGKLDILINNAGINYDTYQNVVNADLENVRETIETNLMGPWQTTQILLPLLQKSNAGRIVNVSSESGSLASQTGGTPGYSISKLALNGMTLQMANQLKSSNILVNAVCPGWVRTDMGGSGATRSPEQGADTIIWAALLEDNGPTGKFFRDRKAIAY